MLLHLSNLKVAHGEFTLASFKLEGSSYEGALASFVLEDSSYCELLSSNNKQVFCLLVCAGIC